MVAPAIQRFGGDRVTRRFNRSCVVEGIAPIFGVVLIDERGHAVLKIYIARDHLSGMLDEAHDVFTVAALRLEANGFDARDRATGYNIRLGRVG